MTITSIVHIKYIYKNQGWLSLNRAFFAANNQDGFGIM